MLSKISKDKKITVSHILLITVLIAIIYSNSINVGFLWDDKALIKNNVYVKSPTKIAEVFKSDWGAGAGKRYNFYRPLATLSYMLNYSLDRLNVRYYHIFNILLHILVGISLYWLLRLLLLNRLLSLLTTLLYISHPIHTDSVTYLSGRAGILVALFVVTGFMLYIKSTNKKSKTLFSLSLISYILSLLSKESALIFVLIIFCYHYIFNLKIDKLKIVSLTIVTFIYLFIRSSIIESSLIANLISLNFIQRIPGFFVAIVDYLRILIIPYGLHFDYGKLTFSWGYYKTLLGLFIFIGSIYYALKTKNRDRVLSLSILWFSIALIPVSNIFYPLPFYMSEHYLYIPSIGFFLIFIVLITKLIKKLDKSKQLKISIYLFLVSLITTYSSLTYRQNNYWKNPITFYKHIIKYNPKSTNAYINLGCEYREMSDINNAYLCYKKALDLDKNNEETYNNLGFIYLTKGNIRSAIASFEKAIELNPQYGSAYTNLGNLYSSQKEIDKALPLYKKAIEINPNDASAFYNLAVTSFIRKRYSLAKEYCLKALELGFDKAHPDFLKTLKIKNNR
ncbi:MAG: tetratricopeptide repeat protein [Candidatus Kaelpia imicola]|nr:tetratricopeptide repeat protein [Candidatus Kaelpia imicola]